MTPIDPYIGKVTSITNPKEEIIYFSYDDRGNRITKTIGNDTYSYIYDYMNRLTKIINPLGRSTFIDYDLNGNRTKVTDADGNVTRYLYDQADRQIGIINAEGGITRFEYDFNGNRTAIIDPKGNVYHLSYDNVDNLDWLEDPLGKLTDFDYDGEGRKIKKIDPNNITTDYEYDDLYRLKDIIFPSDQTQNISYAYDANGNRTSVSNNSGLYEFGYDDFNRLTEASGPLGTIRYTYDKRDNLRTIEYPQISKTVEYIYDGADRLIEVKDGGETATYNYQPLYSRILESINYPNGTKIEYSYPESFARLGNLRIKNSSEELLFKQDFSYDQVGNITRITEKDDQGREKEIEYDYDNLYRLIEENVDGSSISYAYDPNGNRVSRTEGSVTTLYEYDEGNRLLSTSTSLPPSTSKLIDVTGYVDDAVSVIVEADNQVNATIDGVQFTAYDVKIHGGWNEIVATATDYQGKVRKDYADIALISSQDETFGYDDNGNMINRSENSSTTTYSYDLKNQLTGIDFPDSRPDQEYVYDGFGNRVQSGGSEVTKYIYSGTRSILELDGQDNVTAVLVRGWGKGGGIGSIIKATRNDQDQYFHYNWRGDVVLLTDGSGEIIQKYEYEAFGKQLNSTSVDNDYQFSTKEYNEDSGLNYFGRRFYDPELGRFISPDPLWFVNGLNLYVFVRNNPINRIDPLGLCEEDLEKLQRDARNTIILMAAEAAKEMIGENYDEDEPLSLIEMISIYRKAKALEPYAKKLGEIGGEEQKIRDEMSRKQQIEDLKDLLKSRPRSP